MLNHRTLASKAQAGRGAGGSVSTSDSLKIISWLSSAIGILEHKWERPFSEAELAVMQTLLDVREIVRKNYEQESEVQSASK